MKFEAGAKIRRKTNHLSAAAQEIEVVQNFHGISLILRVTLTNAKSAAQIFQELLGGLGNDMLFVLWDVFLEVQMKKSLGKN